MAERSRYEEYLICKERGHVSYNEHGRGEQRGPWTVCMKCGTLYQYTKPNLVESQVPEDPNADSNTTDA